MGPERSVSRTQRDLLRLVLDRLVPADDDAPGAEEAIGVDGLLNALASSRYAADRADVMAWIDALDEVINDRTLTADETDDLLRLIDAGHIPRVSAATFGRLVTITAELFYSSPEDQSAERSTPAWSMLGYSPRPSSRHG